MQEKKFVICLGIFFIGFLIFFFVQSKAMEQYSGTATRMSGTLERDYGWNAPQVYFEPSLFHKHAKLVEYTKPVELIVLGDSFSYSDRSWIYYIMRDRDISAHFFHIEFVPVSELLNHQVFRESPPSIMIVEVLARKLPCKELEKQFLHLIFTILESNGKFLKTSFINFFLR